ncbi:UDP-4-amino-4,6-dideoxy-N-acetyl-beta-L-altrosamine transaminase [Patescibacteria group bacterium]|nr:UDP-4-amino-4,6-dideoxy-N-acetyl-beta-L-altrosamine transaminase [Patescibacteria group bacterium]MBU1722110.1 UDP-4-amino-4,6-dideoxy-N-acetyl-beta-L-altrosamine transaminase [Patescibacteria group bacterium]MBU1901600.1 UDP-4-amino-4,6-dideoxy-N-acetyl-beta-L-altrosamine transaminase [Patescibacteria group bacterium]
MIPYGRQSIEEEDIHAVVEALRSDWLTQGPKLKEFEEKLAAYCGAKYAVAVSNGTTALHVAYLGLGIGEGDEVITTPNTFVATSNMLLVVGATPVFCDIDPKRYNIDVEKIESLITPSTKAISLVHFAGHPVDIDTIERIAKKHNLLVIEDSCQALGATYKNKKIGSCTQSNAAVFSFHPVKSITTGEGGAILTNDKELYEKMMRLRTHGVTKDPELLEEYHGDWYFETCELGYNYRMTDMQAALGISQLKQLDTFIEKRNKQATYYNEQLKDVSNIVLPTVDDTVRSAWHLYVIQVLKEHRKEIFDAMREAGIGVQVHHVPVHIHPLFKKVLGEQKYLVHADEYYSRCFSLPIFPKMTREEQNHVIGTLKHIMETYE